MIIAKDDLRLGLILGLIGPMLGLLVLHQWKFPDLRLLEFINVFIQENRLITSIGSMSLLVNAALFTIYVNTDKDRTAKGIFFVTLCYGIGIILLKLFN
jgi:hypothetical protein